MHNLAEFMSFAHTLANASRALVLDCLAVPVSFATKGDLSPVTVVDQQVEQCLRGLIAERYPQHGILGEEYDSQNLDAEYVWVLDPIDGTKAFITGMPVFGTLISLTRAGHPCIGIIDHPVTGERWAGVEGSPSTYNGQPVRCRPCPDMREAIVSIGNPESLSAGEQTAFSTLRRQSKWGIYGGNCYVYGRLAMGRVDISIDSGLDPFDYCALDVVVRGAGGCMSDWEGKPLSIHSGHRVVATGDAALHRQVVDILAGA